MPDYRVVFHGNDGQTISLGGKSLDSGAEYIFKQEELPLSYSVLKTIPKLTVEKIQAQFSTPTKTSNERIYKLVFNGANGQSLSLAGRSLQSGVNNYFKYSELPMSLGAIRSIKSIKVEEVDSIPADYNVSKKNKVGVKWIGMFSTSAVGGDWEPGEVKYDLDPSDIEYLCKLPKFMKV
jgi:hypothetical protein